MGIIRGPNHAKETLKTSWFQSELCNKVHRGGPKNTGP